MESALAIYPLSRKHGAYKSLLAVLDCPYVTVHVCMTALTNTKRLQDSKILQPQIRQSLQSTCCSLRWRAKYYSPGIQGPCPLGRAAPPAFLKEPGTEENDAGNM